MKVVIAGGSGHLGRILGSSLHREGHEVVVLTRAPMSGIARAVSWDGRSLGAWVREIDGADVLINLAGRSVNCRYTARNRREIMSSRVESTHVLGRAITQVQRPPRVWLQSSTATIYAHRYEAPNDEVKGRLGGDEPGAPDTWRFSIDVARAWEQTCLNALTPMTRKVLMRTAMVMSAERGGVFEVLSRLTRWGLGGRVGDGRQYVSWLHEADFCAAVHFLIAREDLSDAVNLASPNPLPYAEFLATLCRAQGIRFGLPASRWMIELGTFLMRTESELVLKSRRVVPRRLLDAGFRFEFPGWTDAATQLLRRQR